MEGLQTKYEQSSWASKLLFIFVVPIIAAFRKSNKCQLPEIPADFQFTEGYDRLKKNWANQQARDSPSFFQAILRTVGTEFVFYSICMGFNLLPGLVQCVLVYFLVGYLEDADAPYWQGILLVGLSAFNFFAGVLISARGGLMVMMTIGKLKNWVSMLVAEKLTRVPHSTLTAETSRIFNVLGSDIELYELLILVSYFILSPLILLGAATILWSLLGGAGLCGLAYMLIHLLLFYTVSKVTSSIKSQLSSATDARIQGTSSAIEGIRVIKLHAWEDRFLARTKELRAQEERGLLRLAGLQVLNRGTSFGLSASCMLFPLLLYVMLGNSLSLQQAFASMSTLYLSNLFFTYILALALRSFFLFLGACRRIGNLLLLPELQSVQSGEQLQVKKAKFGWDSTMACLKDIDFDVAPGELLAITGDTGSGKTSLLMSILGELTLQQGSLSTPEPAVFCPEQPWVIQGTIKENILVGRKLDHAKLRKCIQMSALADDIGRLSQNEDTLVSDRGTSLSGGQRSRLALARALYEKAALAVFDDPFSAVDSKVKQELLATLLQLTTQGRIVVVATHDPQVIRVANKLLILDKGRQIHFGDTAPENGLPAPKAPTEAFEHSVGFSEENDYETPHSTLKIFLQYCLAGCCGIVGFMLTVLVIIASQLSLALVYFYINAWVSTDPDSVDDSTVTELLVLVYVLGYLRYLFPFLGLLRANTSIYFRALRGILKAPASYFDQHAVGSLLSRFTKDTDILDEHLLHFIIEAVNATASLLGNLCVIILIAPYALAGLAIYGGILVAVFRFVVPASKRLRSIELETRGPLLTTISSIIAGSVSIRTMGFSTTMQNTVKQESVQNMRSYFAYHSVLRYTQFLNDIGSAVVAFVSLVAIVSLKDVMEPGLSSIVLSIIASSLGFAAYWSKTLVEVSNYTVSCSRLFEFANVQSEEQGSEPFRVSAGCVEFKNVSLRYTHDSPLVLSSVSFTVSAGAKLGIVGRTGAGKSSLIHCLLRLTSLADGQILIDGNDLSKVKLSDLRRQISVIPQSPFIFAGTLRENIDPTHEFTDQEIGSTLRQAGLRHWATEEYFTRQVSAASFSSGERQLVSLARALLQQNHIVVMDEATANVDDQAELLVHRALQGVTLLVIAHKLRNIADSDWVLVMEDGHGVEFDNPRSLAANPSSAFAKLLMTSPDQKYFEHALDSNSPC